jgi:hypothetical protein
MDHFSAMIPVLAQRKGILGLISGPRIVSRTQSADLVIGIPRPRLIASPSAQIAARPSESAVDIYPAYIHATPLPSFSNPNHRAYRD